MQNERLRKAMVTAHLGVQEISEATGVDPKTVQRWLNGRAPHARHRWTIAELVKEDERYLWPTIEGERTPGSPSTSEVVAAYGHRADVPPERWWSLLVEARREVDLLAYAMLFLPEAHPRLFDLLRGQDRARRSGLPASWRAGRGGRRGRRPYRTGTDLAPLLRGAGRLRRHRTAPARDPAVQLAVPLRRRDVHHAPPVRQDRLSRPAAVPAAAWSWRDLRELRQPLRGRLGRLEARSGGGRMTRIEHFNDPDAPPANSLIPAASAIVVDEARRILLIRRSDNALWSIPGGAMEVGERIAETVVREVGEETGLEVVHEAIVGIYSNPRHVIEYAEGEVRQQI